jgi:hypothetical protein
LSTPSVLRSRIDYSMVPMLFSQIVRPGFLSPVSSSWTFSGNLQASILNPCCFFYNVRYLHRLRLWAIWRKSRPLLMLGAFFELVVLMMSACRLEHQALKVGDCQRSRSASEDEDVQHTMILYLVSSWHRPSCPLTTSQSIYLQHRSQSSLIRKRCS